MTRRPAVMVVGAGPAGSATALLLARAGVEVLLVDRSAFPRSKACGDCLSLGASRVLERLGVLDDVEAVQPAKLRGWRILAPDGHAFAARFDSLGARPGEADAALAMQRRDLDACLHRAALAAGAVPIAGNVFDFQPGRPPLVRVRTGRVGGDILEIRPRFVVGADGLRSRIATGAGVVARPPRTRKLSLTLHVEGLGNPAEFGEMHLGDGLCLGIAPTGRGFHNVTLVADRRHAPRVRADAPAFFASALRSFPSLADIHGTATLRGVPLFRALAMSDVPFLASGPFDRPVRRVQGPGFALAGDAAGYFDPFTGQGVHQALRSAELLAPAILDALARPRAADRAMRRYALRLMLLKRPTFLMQRGIDLVLGRPASANAAIARLSRAPRAASAILAATADVHSPLCLLSPFALLSFALPSDRRWS